MPATVSLVRDPASAAALPAPVDWAIGQLQAALSARQVRVESRSGLAEVPRDEPSVVVAGGDAAVGRQALAAAGVTLPDAAESLALVPATVDGRSLLLATGRDTRGLVYAVLELADRAAYAADPLAALQPDAPLVELPANRIRSVMRLFASDVEDLGWFHDREFWRGYLTTLAGQRFNRFNLALGLGYDFPRGVADAYLYFAYPFLLDLPGYSVRVRELPDAERERNLETLRFIARETAARGLHFQLGLWTHAYETQNSPQVNYTVEGLTPENHAGYCRDAVRALLQAVPEIGGVSIRIHGESGIAEGSYDFWRTVFQGVASCGRRVELDLHPKGLDWKLIEIALQVAREGGDLPVIIAPKYWAEHQGLPYHQAAIRPTEQVLDPGRWEQSHMAFSAGTRRFTRYGYADFLREDRQYGVLHRVWPGTQRLLLWGDPAFAAAYGRAGSFAGSDGLEWFDPLSFKGRKGSGLPGNRTAYADPSLVPEHDWQKYAYTYRLLGRLAYAPDAAPETWQRFLRAELGPAAESAGAALASASRILPLVTTAHLPSAANYGFWAELPTNMPIVDEQRPHPYGDTPAPKRFGTVSPLDPQLFSRVDDYAGELLAGEASGKYSPLEVAQWLEDLARAAEQQLARAEAQGDRAAPAFRRLAADVRIQAGVGRYYAEKLRAGVAYAVYVRTHDRHLLRTALDAYRRAREGWAAAAAAAAGVYVDDLTFGPVPYLRGTWADRLPAIDADIADMAAELERANQAGESGTASGAAAGSRSAGSVTERWHAALRTTAPGADRGAPDLRHVPAAYFQPGAALPVEVEVPAGAADAGMTVRLHYRRLNQVEPWQSVDAAPSSSTDGAGPARYRVEIPAPYTDSPYPLQYYVVVRSGGTSTLWPGIGPDLAGQPYIVVRRAATP